MRLSMFVLLCVAAVRVAPVCIAATPAIQSVVSAASYGPGTASAAWTAITGVNLATSTRAWGTSDFINGNLPTQLDGVSVTVNGKPAYIYFVSPGQINILPPDDPATGSVAVQVTNSQGTSSSFMAGKQVAAPALFAYSQLGGVFAVIQAAANYSLVGPPRLIGPTVPTFTATPGESLVLYATGLGPTSPPQPTGQLVQTSAPTASPVTVTIGGQTAPVGFAGIIGSGLYQINVTVPALPSGNAAIVVTVGSQKSTQKVSVPIQAYISPSSTTAPPFAGCLSGAVDSISFLTARLSYGQADSASIGGTMLCATCTIKPPFNSEFAARLERALERKETVKACYDKLGNVYQVKLTHP